MSEFKANLSGTPFEIELVAEKHGPLIQTLVEAFDADRSVEVDTGMARANFLVQSYTQTDDIDRESRVWTFVGVLLPPG